MATEQDVILGVDIGGTKCAVCIGNTRGEVLHRLSEPTDGANRSPEAVMNSLADKGKTLIATVGAASVIGVGVSCGGPLDTTTGIIYAPPNLPEWKAVPVRSLLEDALQLPVRVENDANATALAEWKFGAGIGTQNMVFMTMGTGIGGGIIADGRLIHGRNDLAGELGHQTILIDGPLCGCGKRGCLEALASGPSIERSARESDLPGREKRVLHLAGGDLNKITAAHIVQAAIEGDDFANAILQRAGRYMGIGIANIIQMLNPERVILGTIAVHAGDLILEPIRKAVSEFAWKRSAEVCSIVPAALGDRAQDLAAIALWLQ